LTVPPAVFVSAIFTVFGVASFAGYLIFLGRAAGRIVRLPWREACVLIPQLSLIALLLLGWTLASFSFLVHDWYGGFASDGYCANGKCFVSSHGKLMEVTESEWYFVRDIEFWCFTVAGSVGVISFVVMLFFSQAIHRVNSRRDWLGVLFGWTVNNNRPL
jgi:hypothetical protein